MLIWIVHSCFTKTKEIAFRFFFFVAMSGLSFNSAFLYVLTLIMITSILIALRTSKRRVTGDTSLGVKDEKLVSTISYEHNFNRTTKHYIINEHNFNRITNWCIIDNNTTNKPMSNIAHSSEIIISCWNWFETQQKKVREDNSSSCLEMSMDSTFMDCGFYFGNLTLLKMVTPLRNRESWTVLFIQHMNCVLSDLSPSRPDVIWHRPNIKRYFDTLKSTVQLRTRILASITIFYNDSSKFKEINAIKRRKNNNLQIGLIDRKGSRAIKNKESIQKAMISIFPSGHYEMAFMEDLSPLEQWQFWASKDIILAAHGQAEANAIFLHPNSSIIEMYPPHYYPQYFNGLFHSIGIHHFPFYNDVQNWHEDHINHSTTIVDRAFYRGVKYINPNVSSIMILFQQGLLQTSASLHSSHNNFTFPDIVLHSENNE